MAQIAHVAMTDCLKIELIGEEGNNGCFTCSVFELIDGTWHYLDSAPTELRTDSSDGQIRRALDCLVIHYMDFMTSRKTNAIQNAPMVMETY